MIIVSQNKIKLVNFDLVESIDIVADLDGTGKIPYKIYYKTESTREELGEYKTVKRAEKVLQEITRHYRMTEGIKCSDKEIQLGIIQEMDKENRLAFVYEMPEN